MLPLLFLALLQTVADGQTRSRDARPVRVWLGSSALLTRGTAVRVYLHAALDRNLIRLHRRTDRPIDVMFPAKPEEDPFVRAGTSQAAAPPSSAPGARDGRSHARKRTERAPPAPSGTIALSMRGWSATALIPGAERAAGGAALVPKPIEPRARAPLVLPRERSSLAIR